MNIENKKQSFSLKQRLVIWTSLFSFGILSWLIWVRPGQKIEVRYEVKRAEERASKLKALQEEEAKELKGYGWQDEKAKTAKIPIQEAMKLALDRLSQKPVRKGSVIAAAISGGMTNNPPVPTNNPPQPTNNPPTPTNNPPQPTNNPPQLTNNPPAPNTMLIKPGTNEVRKLVTNPSADSGFLGGSANTNQSGGARANNVRKTDSSTRGNQAPKKKENNL